MKKIYMLLAAVLLMVMTGCSSGDDSKSPPSTSKAITAFYLYGVVGTIDETAKTIDVTMPYGTKRKSLVAMFRTTGKSVTVDSTPQVSEKTPNDFSSPVDYTVTAEDGSSVIYTVTVIETLTPKPRAFTAFSLTRDSVTVVGTINETEKKISVRMPSGTNLTALVATFTTAGATVYVGSNEQFSGVTANNFTKPVVYTVTAAGSSTTYTVKVNDYVETKREYDSHNDGTIDTVYYYSYYADGRKAKDEIDSNNDGTIDNVIIYGYDSKSNITQVEYDAEYDANNNGTIDYVYYHTYNANDKIEKTEFDLYNDGTIDAVDYYTYVAGKKTKAEFDSHNDGTIDNVHYYTYIAGNMTKDEYDSNNDGTIDSVHYYTYVADKMTKDEYDSNNDGTIDSVHYYTYVADKMTKDEYDSNNDGTIDNVTIYIYDANGNKWKDIYDYNYGVYIHYWFLI